LACALQRLFGRAPLVIGSLRFNLEIVVFDLEFPQLLPDSRPGNGGMFHRMPQSGCRVDRGKDLAPRRFYVALQAFDVKMSVGVCFFFS
jgi:hypothetical protein